jgi:hypothetical protein
MKGNPLLRVLFLTLSLAVMGTLIASLARQPEVAGPPEVEPSPQGTVPTILTIQLSGPASAVSLRSLDGETSLLETTSPELTIEESLQLHIQDDHFSALLSVTWTAPGSRHFLRLLLEPEGRESSEVLLHAPTHLENHAVEFDWSTD